MKNSKILNIALSLIMLFSILAFPASAASRIIDVYDEADLLTDSEESKLIDSVTEDYGNALDINIIFVTTDDADGKSTQAYADDYYDELTEKQSEYSGILFLIDMDNREITISTAGNCITWFNDDEIEIALDKGYEYISNGKYYKTFTSMADYSLDTIQYWYESGDTPEDDYDSEPSIFDGIISVLPISMFYSLIATVIVVFISIFKHNSANKKVSAVNYIDKSGKGYKVTNRNKYHVRTYETVSRNYYKQSSSSSGGRSSGGSHRSGSSHRSSSGRSHGGGSRKF